MSVSCKPNIALFGRSGSGKTTMAEWLISQHGYQRCSTGSVCRRICRTLFDSEARSILNHVTDAMKAIDGSVWLRAALAQATTNQPIVFDSMRFREDYDFLVMRGSFRAWRITAPTALRNERLRLRGQCFDAATDECHPSEHDLDCAPYEVTFDTGEMGLTYLCKEIDRRLFTLPPASDRHVLTSQIGRKVV